MARPKHVRAPRKRGPSPRWRREGWFCSFRRIHHSLFRSVRLISAGLLTASASNRCAHRHPLRAVREASGLLAVASRRIRRATREIEELKARLALEPEIADPEDLAFTAERCAFMAKWLSEAEEQVLYDQMDVLEGLETGTLVPERPAAERRPRIVVAPRPVPIRAFLLLRQPRMVDRIAPLLRRRRHTPRPVALRVPRRSVLGRAPPLVPVCLL